IGNVEGKDIMRGKADVVITDGFTGNIMIKAIEGFGELIFYMLGGATGSAGHGGKPHSERAAGAPLSDMSRRLDWSEHGGAVLLGVKGSVVVAHGRSKAKAITNAIRVARVAAERVPESIA
ncbi:MAG: phosphate acyltransferase, partial [Chloroflexi bacterium]|nr:phosphate acyltransferase [Chloroflexota bacterium]